MCWDSPGVNSTCRARRAGRRQHRQRDAPVSDPYAGAPSVRRRACPLVWRHGLARAHRHRRRSACRDQLARLSAKDCSGGGANRRCTGKAKRADPAGGREAPIAVSSRPRRMTDPVARTVNVCYSDYHRAVAPSGRPEEMELVASCWNSLPRRSTCDIRRRIVGLRDRRIAPERVPARSDLSSGRHARILLDLAGCERSRPHGSGRAAG